MNIRGKAARTALRLSHETFGLEWDGRPVVGPDRLLKRLQEVHGSEIATSPTTERKEHHDAILGSYRSIDKV